MGGMIKYEWKKIWKNRLTQLSVIGCSLFVLFCAYMELTQITTTDENGQAISGMRAVERLKNIQQRQELTQDRVDEIVNQYLTYIHDPDTSSNNEAYYYLSEEQYKKYFRSNIDLLRLIYNIYSEPGSDENMRDVFEKNVGKDFRQARLEWNLKYIHLNEEWGRLTSIEADYWEEETEKIPEYQYGYHKGWEMILNALSWSIMLMMITCIGIAPIFSGEYQSKCDSLFLCMKYGKSKLIAVKLITAWLFTTCVYWGITLSYSAVYLGVLGTAGADLPIQLAYPSQAVGYHFTMGEAVVYALILAYVLTLGISGLTILISALLNNTYGVIVIVFLFIILPFFLSVNTGWYTWNHIVSLLPTKISDFEFNSYTAYSIGDVVIRWPDMAMLVNGAGAVLFSAAGYWIFKNHQVNK